LEDQRFDGGVVERFPDFFADFFFEWLAEDFLFAGFFVAMQYLHSRIEMRRGGFGVWSAA